MRSEVSLIKIRHKLALETIRLTIKDLRRQQLEIEAMISALESRKRELQGDIPGQQKLFSQPEIFSNDQH